MMKYLSLLSLVFTLLGTVAKAAATSTLTLVQTTTNTVPKVVLVTVGSSNVFSVTSKSQDCQISGCASQDLSLPWTNSTARETLSMTSCFTRTVTQFVTSPDATTTIYPDATSTPCGSQTTTSILTITVYPVAATESTVVPQGSGNATVAYSSPFNTSLVTSNQSGPVYPSGWSILAPSVASSTQTESSNLTTAHASGHSIVQPSSLVTPAVITFSGSAGGRIKPPRPITLLAEMLVVAGVVRGQHDHGSVRHHDHEARFIPFVAAADALGVVTTVSASAKPDSYIESETESASVLEPLCQMSASSIVVISTTTITALPSQTVSGDATPRFISMMSVDNRTIWWDPLHNRTVTGTVMPTIFTGFFNTTTFDAFSSSTLDVTSFPTSTIIANKTATFTKTVDTPAYNGPMMTMPAEGDATCVVASLLAVCLALIIGIW